MKIFILEDDPTRIGLMAEALGGLFTSSTDVAHDMNEVEKAFKPPYDIMFLDHDLGGRQFIDSADPNTGYTFVCGVPLNDKTKQRIVVRVHSYNPDGARAMVAELRQRGYDAIAQPFGPTLLREMKDIALHYKA